VPLEDFHRWLRILNLGKEAIHFPVSSVVPRSPSPHFTPTPHRHTLHPRRGGSNVLIPHTS
jgi:hypothetical protein